jgi:hypothetical protein
MRGRVTFCRSQPWCSAQRRAGLYRESWAVQPSWAQVRVSPKARTIGPAPAARRLSLRIGTAMLALFPHPSRANASRPRHTHRSARCGRIGSVDACPGPFSCGAGCGGWGWAGWAWPEGLGPTGADAWSAAGPAQIGGQVAGCRGPREPARSAAVDPGPGAGLAVTELLARVGGSSVSLNCPCADQGGRHVDMVVGADHRGRAGVGVWRDAATARLTARRQRPDHGRRSCSTRPTAWWRGRWSRPSGPQPTTQRRPARRARYPAGVGASAARLPRTVGCWQGRVVRPRGAMSGACLGWTPLSHRGQVRCCRGGGRPPRVGIGVRAGMGVETPEDRRTVWRSP